MKKLLPISALLGTTGLLGLIASADATPVAVTLVSVTTYYSGRPAVFNRALDTSTWVLDTAVGTAWQTGGVYSGIHYVGPTSLTRQTMTGGILGWASSAATWSCIEGDYSRLAGISICGAYNFGSNHKNQSTYTPTATGGTVTLGGDDFGFASGPQSVQSQYSRMVQTAVYVTGAPLTTYCLSNTNYGCGDTRNGTGYDFVFEISPVPIPPAVWLFGSALGLMGVMRRKIRS